MFCPWIQTSGVCDFPQVERTESPWAVFRHSQVPSFAPQTQQTPKELVHWILPSSQTSSLSSSSVPRSLLHFPPRHPAPKPVRLWFHSLLPDSLTAPLAVVFPHLLGSTAFFPSPRNVMLSVRNRGPGVEPDLALRAGALGRTCRQSTSFLGTARTPSQSPSNSSELSPKTLSRLKSLLITLFLPLLPDKAPMSTPVQEESFPPGPSTQLACLCVGPLLSLP